MQYAFYTQDPDRIRDACDRVNASGIERHYSNSGATWLYAGNAYTWYNHILEPNSAIPDCTQSGSSLLNAAVTARSQHSGGVNLALADGSVRIVADTIALEIWRALARISDGVPM